MKRKSFTFQGLKFFERNKDDMDFAGVAERLKAHNFAFIQENTDNEDNKLSLLMSEMHRDYTIAELNLFMYGNSAEILNALWDSYRINPSANGELLTKEQLSEKIKGKERNVLTLLLEMERPKKKKTKAQAES